MRLRGSTAELVPESPGTKNAFAPTVNGLSALLMSDISTRLVSIDDSTLRIDGHDAHRARVRS
jgi:hypothetical protein